MYTEYMEYKNTYMLVAKKVVIKESLDVKNWVH